MNDFMYVAGDEAEDIFNVLPLTEGQKKLYKLVMEAFEKHFISKQNVIYERACFKCRSQQLGESVEFFLTAIHTLAEHFLVRSSERRVDKEQNSGQNKRC